MKEFGMRQNEIKINYKGDNQKLKWIPKVNLKKTAFCKIKLKLTINDGRQI